MSRRLSAPERVVKRLCACFPRLLFSYEKREGEVTIFYSAGATTMQVQQIERAIKPQHKGVVYKLQRMVF